MDHWLFKVINRFAGRTSWLHGVERFYADYGIVLFAILLVVGYLISRQGNDRGAVAGVVWAGAGTLVALGIGQLIGGAIDRLRPYEVISNTLVLVDRTTDFSFPSDHATMAGAVAVGLLLAERRLGIIATVAALWMAFTRVYVGAHFPSDVVGGLVLGGLVAVIGHYLLVPLLRRIADWLATTPVAWLVRS